jgi:phage terminase large subunit-like protein
LTRDTTVGFDVEDFARDRLRRPLDPWQRWLVIHAMERLPNGWPRFRQVVVLVARQNGKTELLVILAVFWMWQTMVDMVLGTSTKLDYSRESWLKLVKLVRRTPEFAADIAGRGAVRSANGEQEVCTPWDSRYKIAAANEEGGRSLTVDRLIEDEIRQHYNYSAHAAAENTMNAVPDAQAWAISNEGDDRSVVLHDLYDAAFLFIETGEGDERLGLFAYSAPDGCDLEDEVATAQANPNLGRRIFWANLVGKARRAKLAGGEQEAKYRTEVLCQRVKSMAAKAISLDAWAATALDVRPDGAPMFFVTIAKDMTSATISVAATHEGAPHVELADHRGGTGWLTGRLRGLARRHPGAKFAAWRAGRAVCRR